MERCHFAGIKLHHCGELTMRSLEKWKPTTSKGQSMWMYLLVQTCRNTRSWYIFSTFPPFISLYAYYRWRDAFPHSPQTKSSSAVFYQQLCGVTVWNTSLHIFTPPKQDGEKTPSAPPLLLIFPFSAGECVCNCAAWIVLRNRESLI